VALTLLVIVIVIVIYAHAACSMLRDGSLWHNKMSLKADMQN